jgi:hypothetical protein
MNEQELQAARSTKALRHYLDTMEMNLNGIRYKQVIQQVVGEMLDRKADGGGLTIIPATPWPRSLCA